MPLNTLVQVITGVSLPLPLVLHALIFNQFTNILCHILETVFLPELDPAREVCVGAPLEGDDPHVLGLAAVGDGGLGAARACEVAGLREEAGVRQVGDVPGPQVSLPPTLRSYQEPLEGCPAPDGDSEI